MVGVMAESRPLAGADGIGRALDQSVGVGDAWLGGEVVHLVVQQEAQAFGGDARPQSVVQSRRDGDRIAFGIDHGKVGCILWFAGRSSDCNSRYPLQFVEDGRTLEVAAWRWRG